MRCPRCEGFIVGEDLAALNEEFLSGFRGWRCVNCGAIGDAVIQSHQKWARPLPNKQVPTNCYPIVTPTDRPKPLRDSIL